MADHAQLKGEEAASPNSAAAIGIWHRLTAFSAAWPGFVAGALGLVTATGFPPLHAWWIALPALALFVAHIRAAPTRRSAFWRGWVFGWAHLTLANNWIATAFTHQAKMPEALGWAAVPLLCIYLAVYPALAALAVHLLARRAGSIAFGIMFAAAWIVAEWLRSWVFTGYPWPPLGLILLGDWGSPGLARLLPWLGTYALSGVTILIATTLLLFGSERPKQGGAIAAVLAVIAAMVWPGSHVVAEAEGQAEAVRFTLVQPYIPQDEINDGSQFEAQFLRLAEPTIESREQSRVVLWPEGTIPDYLESGYPQRYYDRMTFGQDPEAALGRIGQVIGSESTLLTGVVNLNIGAREDGSLGALSARNSVVGINGQGDLTHHYAKAHLVPYGEYLPLEWMLGPLGLARLSAGAIPYIPGPGAQTLDLGEHGRAGVQICYEIVFSGQVVDRNDRPDYLFNPSNDGWFGQWGPPQHLAQARMRAIEEGLPVLRATTTGISAVINADGIVLQTIASGKADKLEGFIPPSHPPTLFAKLGNALPLLWAALLAVLSLCMGFGLPRLLALRAVRG